MNNIFIVVIAFMLQSLHLVAQERKSVIQEQNEYYKNLDISAEEYYQINKPEPINKNRDANSCQLNKMVFGWHPYWQNGYETNYDWNLISDFCYFSYEVDAATGNATNIHGFDTTSVVDAALASGTHVHLCVTLFANHATFLESASSKQQLIDNLISLIGNRSAKGINIDFESVPSAQKTNLTNFIIDLSQQMHNALPGSIVSIDLPAVDWNSTFEVGVMSAYVDYFMIMGYDYYWKGSAQAGPNSPLYTFNNNYDYNLSKSISFYTHAGVSSQQLILGIPYYGREWPTENSSIPSNTTANGNTITYKSIKTNSSGHYSTRHWNTNSKTPYYVYNDGEWNQCFSDDEESLRLRYDMVHYRGLAGIGIWALGYDDGYTELWDAIADKLTDCRITTCSDTIYDMGGAYHNYYNNEDYSFTIAPDQAVGLTLNFLEFELENTYDTLWIYDGSDTNAPEIGNYTNTNSPGLITATGAALTLKFHSDGSTNMSGYKAVWQCTIDNEPPTTNIQSINDWQTQDFDINFTDNDNSAVESSFYQLVENDGTSLKTNTNKGTLFDNFNNIDSWVIQNGTWTNSSEILVQTDENISNTNIYTSLTQDNNLSYLYNWKMKISGSGTNRRAGIHFFSDDATLDQRNNSYMVYFRADQNKCQLYKSTDNNLLIETDDTCIVNIDTWYDYKILFNPITGRIKAYQNNQLVSEWTDNSPLTSGSYLSLRTGNSNVYYKDFRIYKSRNNTITASIGSSAEKDIRIQNTDPNTASCQVKSIVKDIYDNFSDIATEEINIDWTIPLDIDEINDGNSSDIDTSNINSSIEANYAASTDENSGILKYWYAIGTSPGTTDILNWTDNLNTLSFSKSLSLNYNQTYYVSVKSENGAGLFSNIITSDGVLILNQSVNIEKFKKENYFSIYPNPAHDFIVIANKAKQSYSQRVEIYDFTGKIVKQFKIQNSELKINIGDLRKGVYIIRIGQNKQILIIH